jgi:hypothetical protein
MTAEAGQDLSDFISMTFDTNLDHYSGLVP